MYKKGTIILVPFPFTDLSSKKVRPAVIVSDKLLGDDLVVSFISSTLPRRLSKTDVPLKADSPGFSSSGLKMDSHIKVSKIATLDKKIVLGELGKLSSNVMSAVDSKLKLVFAL